MLHIDSSAAFRVRNNLRDDLLSVRREVADAWRALQTTLIDSRALMIEADRIMNWPAQSPTSISKPICHDSSNWATRAEELRQLAANMKVVGAQTIMLRLAADYDRLAENAESYVTKTP